MFERSNSSLDLGLRWIKGAHTTVSSDPFVREIKTSLDPNYLKELASIKPHRVLCELIWNALDADATMVEVKLEMNLLDTVEGLEICDNGHGILFSDVDEVFGKLGYSKKRLNKISPKGRPVHGENGKGRYTAFSFSSQVRWEVVYWSENALQSYQIIGHSDGNFSTKKALPWRADSSGTKVSMSIQRTLPLKYPRVESQIVQEFAIFLLKNPEVTVRYDGQKVEPRACFSHAQSRKLSVTLQDQTLYAVPAEIIEWNRDFERTIYLCDDNGLVYHESPVGVHTRGLRISLFVRSTALREALGNPDSLSEMYPGIEDVKEICKGEIKKYALERVKQLKAESIGKWKKEGIYPYNGEGDISQKVERKVFDVCALQIQDRLPSFQKAEIETKKLMFRLLQVVVQEGSPHLNDILREVLKLTGEEQEQFSQILSRTNLKNVVKACNEIQRRLTFLRGLEDLVFEPEFKGKLKERSQLHKIIQGECWIFGDRFALTASDRGLTYVLKEYCNIVGAGFDGTPVNSQDIVDLFLSRQTMGSMGRQPEFLVVELKRPKKKIGLEEVSQAQRYAFSIVMDQRFQQTEANWTFVAVSDEITREVGIKISQPDKPAGQIDSLRVDKANVNIWAKTWAQIIDEARGRLEWFQERLNLTLETDDGVQYLQQVYQEYLPSSEKTAEDEYTAVSEPSPDIDLEMVPPDLSISN